MSDLSLLSRIKLGAANTKLVKWPGTDELVTLRVLSIQERQEAAFATERHFKTSGIDVSLATAGDYDEEKSVQLLYRALKAPKDNVPVAKTIGEFRAALSREEKGALIDEYLTFERDCAPSPDNLTEDEFDKLLTEVKKNAQEMLSASYSTGMLKRLCTSLVNQLATVQSHNSSGSEKLRLQSSSDEPTPPGKR